MFRASALENRRLVPPDGLSVGGGGRCNRSGVNVRLELRNGEFVILNDVVH